MRRLARLLATLAALLAVPAFAAAPVDAPPAWASLTVQQQAALAPLQRDWASIDVPRKQKWLEVASRFPRMSDTERQRIQQRMAEWARLTPAERGRARLQFQESRQIPAEDRQARWEAYQALPDDERRALAQRAVPAAKPAARPAATAGTSNAEVDPKRNILPPVRPATVRPVAPTVVQARPGATTTLMSAPPAAPAHQQPGLPKIVATEGFVEPNTLLPRRGAQGAAVSRAASASASAPGR